MFLSTDARELSLGIQSFSVDHTTGIAAHKHNGLKSIKHDYLSIYLCFAQTALSMTLFCYSGFYNYMNIFCNK